MKRVSSSTVNTCEALFYLIFVKVLKYFLCYLLCLTSLLTSYSFTALARKFDFKTEHLSTYLSLGLTYPNLDKKPFASSSGTDTVFAKQYNVISRTSIGFVLTFSQFINFNLGLGWIWSSVNTKGYNPTSTYTRFDLKSSLVALNPHLSLEVRLFRSQLQRFYIFFGGGWGRFYLTNKYDLTEQGIRDLNLTEGRNNYKERLKNNFISKHLGVAWESLFLDVVTIFLGVGFVHRPINQLIFQKSTSTLFQGDVKAGDVAKTHTGEKRKFHLNSFFLQMGFRFYIY